MSQPQNDDDAPPLEQAPIPKPRPFKLVSSRAQSKSVSSEQAPPISPSRTKDVASPVISRPPGSPSVSPRSAVGSPRLKTAATEKGDAASSGSPSLQSSLELNTPPVLGRGSDVPKRSPRLPPATSSPRSATPEGWRQGALKSSQGSSSNVTLASSPQVAASPSKYPRMVPPSVPPTPLAKPLSDSETDYIPDDFDQRLFLYISESSSMSSPSGEIDETITEARKRADSFM